jgi:23S rRNA (guanine2445-N2)-methyltransferase / 23S rRNA (guanine2069-N7)-methyltransferase
VNSSVPDDFRRRLEKNLRHLARWRRNHDVTCFRLYSRELPELPLDVDVYEERAHVQVYDTPRTRLREFLESLLPASLDAVAEVLGIGRDAVHVKFRRRQRGADQYERLGTSGRFEVVSEGGCRFLVNLEDYLDTGLFLDHRLTRSLIRDLAPGTRFLNLFCYTASASVAAASGGARETTSVDRSATYLDWARRNFRLNRLLRGGSHRFLRADCLEWLRGCRESFDLIFLDPPTFSNSKGATRDFQVQRDAAALVDACLALLAGGGTLIFSNNFRKFRLELELPPGVVVKNITRATIPKDFERDPTVHQCWRIRREPAREPARESTPRTDPEADRG